MRNFFVVLACMTSILLIVACAKSPVDKAMEKIELMTSQRDETE